MAVLLCCWSACHCLQRESCLDPAPEALLNAEACMLSTSVLPTQRMLGSAAAREGLLASCCLLTSRTTCRATRETKKAENAQAELRGRAEAEKEGLRAAAAAAEERTTAAQAAAAKLDQELQSYKAYSCHPSLIDIPFSLLAEGWRT